MHRNTLVTLLGALAPLLLVAACGGAASTTASTSPVRANGASSGVAAGAPAQAPQSSASKQAPDALPNVTVPEGSRVQRSARIALEVANGRFDATLNAVMALVEQAGGYISGTDAQAPDDSQPLRSGQATFQVPAAQFDAVVNDIRKQGTAQSISITGNDVSQQYVDLQARERNAEAQRDAMLALMQQAKTVADTIQVENQLGQVTSQIEQLKGQIDYLDHSTAYSTVAVSIRELAAAGVHDTWGLQTAVSQVAHNIVTVAAYLVLVIGTLLPVLVVAGLVALAGRTAWRRIASRVRQTPAGAAGE